MTPSDRTWFRGFRPLVWLLLGVAVSSIGTRSASAYCIGTEKRLEIGDISEPDSLGQVRVTFHHNCLTGFRWTFPGRNELEDVSSAPSGTLTRSISLACLTGPATIHAEDPPNNLFDEKDVEPLDQRPALELFLADTPSGTATDFRYKWKAPYTSGHLTIYRVDFTQDLARPFVDGNAPAGEGESVVYHEPGSGIFTGWITSCGGRDDQSGNFGGERPCTDCNDSCDVNCQAHPIRTSSGNARFTELDPLPASFVPLRRIYDSRFQRDGVFGRGWTSLFDPRLLVFPGPEDAASGSVALLTDEGEELIFRKLGGTYRQVYPKPGGKPHTLVANPDGTWRYTDPDGRLVRTFNREGKVVAYTERATGRSVQISYALDANDKTYPASVADSWGNWSWTVTFNTVTRRIDAIAVAGSASHTLTYSYSNGDLAQVASTLGVLRTYEHVPVGGSARAITRVRDALGNEIERHDFSGFRATNSYGPGADATLIEYELPALAAETRTTRYTWRSGKVATHTMRRVGTEWRVVEISGGCATCSGGGDGTFVYDPETGNTVREQDARGSITESVYYPSGRLQHRRTNLKPSTCTPTPQDRCRLSSGELASVPVDATSATLTTTYTYDSVWPEKHATIATTSVLGAADRVETFLYHAVSGEPVQHRITGTTALPPATRVETRVTSNAFYNGTEGAAFTVGGAFDPAWQSLPQPALLRKSTDGPRIDVIDVTKVVYHPVHSSVPAVLRGRLAAVQNAAGHITRYETYDLFGNATRMVDPNGVATVMTYDALGRLLTSTLKAVPGCNTTADPLCATDIVMTSRTYLGAGPVATETRPEGGVTRYEYDGESRVSAISRGPSTSDLRERMETDYDPATGKKSAERVRGFAAGSWVTTTSETFAYDADGDLTTTTHADGASVAYDYDAGGQLLSVRDENHTVPNTFYTYDAGGRLTRVEQKLGTGTISTNYGYDRHGNLTSVTDPNGNVTSYVYDDFGQLLKQDSPVSGATTYSYNIGGMLTSTADANGAVITRVYDALGRPIYANAVRNGLASEPVSWGYDSWAGLGRLASMSDPSGFTAWYYTRAGQMRVEQRNIEGTLYTTQQYRFDRNGNPTVMTYPSGRSFTYTYDYADRPVSITTLGATIVSSAQYLPFGPLRELVYGNGSVRTTTYDNRYRIDLHSWANGATTLASYDYAHDAAGNITQMNDLVTAGFHRQFGYDDLHRLTATSTGSQLWGTRPYTYDAMGNIRSTATGIPFTYQGTTPKLATVNEGAGPIPVTYDAAGNEIATGTLSTSTISPRNYVATINTPNIDYTFRYNGQGVRTWTSETPKPPTGTTTKRYHFYTPDLRFLSRADYSVNSSGTATLIRRIEPVWFAGTPVAQIDHNDPAFLRYTFTDHLGAPILQTSTTGAIVWQVDREPYGRVWRIRNGTLAAQPLQLPGQEVATERESYNVFRWYRAAWGRYISPDPIGIRGGHNLYAYAGSNPLRYIDRLGLLRNMVSPVGSVRRSRVDDAISLLQSEFATSCNACTEWFRANAVSRYHDLATALESGTPPFVGNAEWNPDFWGQTTLAGSPPNQDNVMFILDDVIDTSSSCLIASLIMHEMIHLAAGDPFLDGTEVERPAAFTACTSGCVNPSFQ